MSQDSPSTPENSTAPAQEAKPAPAKLSKKKKKNKRPPKAPSVPAAATDTDKTINCNACKEDFVFTVKEQEFYEEKKFSIPKKCKPCRMEAKEKKDQQASANK